jgi:transposase
VAEKLRIVAESEAPGVRVADVAARHGVYRSLIFQWRRQVRDGLLTAEPMPQFMPVHLAGPDAATRRAEPEAAADTAPRSTAGVEIEFPDGVRVRVGEAVGLVMLRRVLAALRG